MNPGRRPLVAGNWKMYHGGASGVGLAHECAGIARECAGIDVVVAPPATVLAACAHEAERSPLGIAGQNLYPKDVGAFTGEVSGPMLRDAGCAWVILGHSERRQYFAETDAFVAEKTTAALGAGLIPIVCVGETLEQREGGETLKVVERQVTAFLDIASQQLRGGGAPVAIAYEPVWAIGTGKTAGPAEAEEVHAFIRKLLHAKDPALADRTRVLYGGSVKPNNAEALLSAPNVDGFLIGGASLEAASFGAIARAAASLAAKAQA